jgi:hypothetical protein
MIIAIKLFKISPKTLKYPILSRRVVKNTTTISILIIRSGWIAEIATEFLKLIFEVPHITRVRTAKTMAQPNTIAFKM